MDIEKAHFFDTQATEAWASAEYTSQETEKLQQALRYAGISSGMNIFEPGCGTGRLTRLLSDQIGSQGNLVALDMSSGMIEVCRHRLIATNNVRLTLGAMEDINLVPGYFDAVVCHNVFHHFKDKPSILQKMGDTLKPGGKFVIHYFLPFSEINSRTGKIRDVIAEDVIPVWNQMLSMLSSAGFKVTRYSDSNDGYVLQAVRS